MVPLLPHPDREGTELIAWASGQPAAAGRVDVRPRVQHGDRLSKTQRAKHQGPWGKCGKWDVLLSSGGMSQASGMVGLWAPSGLWSPHWVHEMLNVRNC